MGPDFRVETGRLLEPPQPVIIRKNCEQALACAKLYDRLLIVKTALCDPEHAEEKVKAGYAGLV
jgi:hypothetical protein